MEKLKIVLNGSGESGVGNIQRALLAVVIPVFLGVGSGVQQAIVSPETGTIPFLLTALAPIGAGGIEFLRQISLYDRKAKEMDTRFYGNIRRKREEIVRNSKK